MLSRSNLVQKIATLYDKSGQEPVLKTAESPFNGRQMSVPAFSFVDQAVSLLTSDLLTTEYLIDDYDIFTGTCGRPFWDPATIDDSDTMAAPIPVDPKRNVVDIHSSYLFQSAVARFCSKPNLIPVPVITGYDKANLSCQGDLAITPLLFTFNFSRVAGGTSHPSGAYSAKFLTFPLASTTTRQQTRKQLNIISA